MIQIADDNTGEEFLENLMKETFLKEQQKKIVEDYLFSRNEILQQNEDLRGGNIC